MFPPVLWSLMNFSRIVLDLTRPSLIRSLHLCIVAAASSAAAVKIRPSSCWSSSGILSLCVKTNQFQSSSVENQSKIAHHPSVCSTSVGCPTTNASAIARSCGRE